VIVGTSNPSKVKGVKMAFERFFTEIEVIAVNVRSGVPKQPFGFKDTVKGAVMRGWSALKRRKGDYGVGIEAGLVKFPWALTGFIDFQVCAIVDRNNKVTVGIGPGFEFPPESIKLMIENHVRELGEAMEKITGIKDIGKNVGAIGWLTKGIMKRDELTSIAVLMALIPRINPHLYADVYKEVKEILRTQEDYLC